MLGNLNFNKSGRVISCRVTIPKGLDNKDLILGPEDIMELTYEFNQDTENVIGATIGKQVTIKMRKDENSSKINWENGKIKVIKVTANNVEQIMYSDIKDGEFVEIEVDFTPTIQSRKVNPNL